MAICVLPCIVTFPVFTLIPPPTVRPERTLAPAFRNAAPVVVSVLFIATGTLNVACVFVRVVPPHLNCPAPILDRLPLTVAVEMAIVDVMPAPPPPGGSPLMDETVRLEMPRAGTVAVGWMTGTHCPNIWIDETLLLM